MSKRITMKPEELIDEQRTYFHSGKSRSLVSRKDALRALKTMLSANESTILEALKADMKKPIIEAYTSELSLLYHEIAMTIKNLKKWMRPVRVRTPLINFPARSHIIPEPYGIIVIISPWNYPFYLALAPLIGALAAGNCVILKPSELAPNSSHLLSELFQKYFYSRTVAVAEGGPDTAYALIQQRPDYVFFTGSTQTGREIGKACGERLIPFTLELGGKNPCIVDEHIPLEVAARRIVWGKFFNAGQTCFAPDFLLVHTSIKEKLLEKLIETITSYYGTKPAQSPDYARIINRMQCRRLCSLLQEGVVRFGGKGDEKSNFIEPTIIDNITWDSKIMQEEIFGPILPILEYCDLDATIDILNKLNKPLALYFFSNDRVKQKKLQDRTISGSLCFNTAFTQIMNRNLPFGGIGESGMGKYHGKATFNTFSHWRSTMRRSLIYDLKVIYPPYRTSLEIVKKTLPWLYRSYI